MVFALQAAEDDEEALDAIAADCGITHFTAQLQRAIVQEEDEDEKQFRARYAPPPCSAALR